MPVVYRRSDDVVLRLFTFPHGGGGPTAYRTWADRLSETIEIVSVALPGRGGLQDAAAFTDWSDLVGEVADMIASQLDGAPFAFFGHSFGALLAFEVCRALRGRGLPLPVCLFLSAHRAAHLPSVNSDPDRQTHALPQDRFLDVVRSWGFVAEDVLADEELLRFVLPPLRNDLKLDELHVFQPGEPLPMRCVVYGGEADHSVSPQELSEWRRHIAPGHPFAVETFPGGHFYTIDSEPELLASIGRHLAEELDVIGPSVIWDGPGGFGGFQPVWELFHEQALRSPAASAIEDGARRWSFRELDRAATALARRLAAMGVGKGDVVGIFMPHCAEYAISLLSVLSLGATACLLEKNWSDVLLDEFLVSSEAKAVIALPDLAGRLPALFRDSGCLTLAEAWEEDLRGSLDALPAFSAAPVGPDDIAFISMTSGSTGKPKAVLTTHRGCTYCFRARFALYPYRADEREGMNVFFAWECLRPLLAGRAAVVIPDDVIFDPLRLVKLIEEARITRLVVTTSLLESVLDYPRLAPTLAERLRNMEALFLMGEVVPARVVEKASRCFPPGLRLVNAYSTWESLDVAYADLLPMAGTPGASAFVPVGRLLSGCAAVLLDGGGKPVPRGTAGELYVAGPGIAPGYLKDETKTAERFLPLPAALAELGVDAAAVYRTGDRARLLPDGQLEILGRIDSTVKIRGFKVSLHAVERSLEDVDGVSRLVVVPVKDEETGQPKALAAYVVGDNGAPSEAALARIRRRARQKLPEYAVPSYYLGLASLPMRQGESRKLDLAALPKPQEAAPAPAAEVARALSTVEERLAQGWREVLGVADVQPDDNFFALGGNSLSAARLAGVLADQFGIVLPVVDVFQYATLADMAARCGVAADKSEPRRRVRPSGEARNPKLAVIGMAGRFPGAASIDEFWDNLLAGFDSLRHFTRDELRGKGIPDHVLDHPNWVSAGQVLDDADKFDARFWGIGQREAEMMDPQHRLFIQTAWAALEQAGYARRNNEYRHRTGVFAACGIDGYLIHHLEGGGLKDWLDPGRLFLTEIGNEKDYAATRVAFLMDLGGPAVTVTSACSSALVAVAQAAQAVMSGQCDMAVAGGVAVNFPNFGYCYEEGLVGSADGRVRPFDDEAGGTLFGDSVGAVVLKRLDDALEDGDSIWAVLSGVGLSNDGRMKAGYAAPSAQAQTRCIIDAMTMAGSRAEQISYVECHATATHVGDAIELKGLHDAFVEMRSEARFLPASCAIGSVKGNIGHANCAAGITGLIKTVLALHHRKLVPTVNFKSLNPKLVQFVDGDDTPFIIHEGVSDWTVANAATQLPRRAGVSSFGIGGTNAHVILEEPPARESGAAEGFLRSHHVVTVSAKTEAALARNLANLTEAVAELDPAGLSSAVYTLHVAREAHPIRVAAVVGRDPAEATATLRTLARAKGRRLKPGHQGSVAFCFSGQGSQHAGMARGLYDGAVDGGRFRAHFDAACAALGPHLGLDAARLILDADETGMRRPVITQCGLFAVEYALASTLLDIGIKPIAVAGHSIGEYAAAVIAGVLALEDAARLVAARATATEALSMTLSLSGEPSEGGMLSVAGDEDQLRDWLAGRQGLWLAVENAPNQAVLAGAVPDLLRAEQELIALGFRCARVPVSHPFHSPLMTPVAERLDEAAQAVSSRPPSIPMTSNITGGWLGEEAMRADYWSRHLLATVRWKDNVATLLRWQPDVILEVGPGNVLCGLVAKCLAARDGGAAPLVIAAMRHPKAEAGDAAVVANMLGQLWCAGIPVDWRAYHQGEAAEAGTPLSRLRLPTYSFEPDSYWVNSKASIYVDAPDEPRHKAPAPSSPWLIRHVARPDARIRLYCFPFAGGSSRSFEEWARSAPDWLDVIAVELPGRNGRAEEPVAKDDAADAVALAALAAAIRADAGMLPLVFCGLSFGATLAMELLSGPLADLGRRGQVQGLVVVGRAPILGRRSLAEADPDTFLMAPPEIRENKLWRTIFLPVLLADLDCDARGARRIDAAWRAGGSAPPLRCHIEVHCGLEDPSFAWADADEWNAATGGTVGGIHYYRGGHDFMLREQQKILARIVGFAAPNLPAAGPPDARSGILHRVQWTPLETPPRAAGETAWVEMAAGREAETLDRLASMLGADASPVAVVCRLAPSGDPVAQCAAFVQLLQGLIERGAGGRLILLLPASAASGPIAGVARVLVQEEASLRVQCVFDADHPDRTGGGIDPAWVNRLASAALAHPDEGDLLRRSDYVLAQRLLPMASPPLPRGLLGGLGGRYLVTGGTGGLGGALVDWLIDHQGVAPENVLLVGRSPRDGHPRGARQVAADFADPAGAERALGELGPIDGIFHLAGLLDDGLIQNLDEARIAKVLTPKLALAGLLRLGRRWGTRWVVAYSSTSALLGAAGQANYAAANAWMDHVAAWPLDPFDPPVATINWGTWAETGMGARNRKALDRARADGEEPLSTREAMEALAAVLATMLADCPAGRRFAACRIEWDRSPWRSLPLAPRSASAPPGKEARGPAVEAAASATPAPDIGDDDPARAFLGQHVRHWEEEAELLSLGFDSLDFAQLRSGFFKQFGVQVPLSVFAAPHRTLGELAAHLSAAISHHRSISS